MKFIIFFSTILAVVVSYVAAQGINEQIQDFVTRFNSEFTLLLPRYVRGSYPATYCDEPVGAFRERMIRNLCNCFRY